jgi:hypothetical protein
LLFLFNAAATGTSARFSAPAYRIVRIWNCEGRDEINRNLEIFSCDFSLFLIALALVTISRQPIPQREKHVKLLTAVLFSSIALCPCSGAVMYTLGGTSPNSPTGPFAVAFQLTTANFITANTSIPAAGLDSCSTGFEVCDHLDFEPVSVHDNRFSHIEFFTTTTSTLFFFPLGSLAAPGVYHTSFGAGDGTLTVSAAAAVPEPATIALTFGVLAALLALRRFRKPGSAA